MGAGSGIGTFIGLFFFGAVLVAFLSAWDYLVYGMNILNSMGYESVGSMNAFYQLTFIMNILGFVFIVALALGLIIQGKNQRSGQV